MVGVQGKKRQTGINEVSFKSVVKAGPTAGGRAFSPSLVASDEERSCQLAVKERGPPFKVKL